MRTRKTESAASSRSSSSATRPDTFDAPASSPIVSSAAPPTTDSGATWGAPERETARLILDRIAAQGRARAFREVRTRAPGINETVLTEAKTRYGVVAPFGPPTSSGMVTLHCPPDKVHALALFLREKGAESVTVADIDYVFTRENPLYAKLEAGLGG